MFPALQMNWVLLGSSLLSGDWLSSGVRVSQPSLTNVQTTVQL